MAKKVHTRRQRYMPIRSGRNRRSRPKSFTSEVQAKEWAAKNGVKEYTLRDLRHMGAKDKKFIIVQK